MNGKESQYKEFTYVFFHVIRGGIAQQLDANVIAIYICADCKLNAKY
jgi:hypothetical protein